MSTPTHASQVVNNLEYVEEGATTYGTFPTNPAMIYMAETAVWSPTMDMSAKEFRRLGSEDLFKMLQGKNVFTSSFTFGISSSTFIKYGVNAIGGAGTIGRSLSLGMSVKIDNVTNFVKIPGSRIASIRLSGNPDNPDTRVTAEMEHSDITTPSTTDYIGIGSHGTAGTAAPFTFTDGGANPITWGATALNVLDINIVIERALSTKWVMGSKTAKYQYPVKRKIGGDITTEWLGTATETDIKAGTARNIAWVLKSAVSTLTLTNATLGQLSDRGLEAEADESAIEKYVIAGAESVTVT